MCLGPKYAWGQTGCEPNLTSLLLKGYTFYYTVIIIYLLIWKLWNVGRMRLPTLNAYAWSLITLLSLWLAKPSQISSVVKGNLYLHQINYDKDFYHHKAKEITTSYLISALYLEFCQSSYLITKLILNTVTLSKLLTAPEE